MEAGLRSKPDLAGAAAAAQGVDALSRLLSLFTLRTSLDIRCALAAPWVLEQPAASAGVAPYHLIVEGEAAVDTPGGERVKLAAGDIVVFPQGGAPPAARGAAGTGARPGGRAGPGAAALGVE